MHRIILYYVSKEHKTNDEVLGMMEIKRLLIDSIRKSKAKYFGHMVIQNGLPRLLLEGKIHGKGGKRKPRITWATKGKDRKDMANP